ncbi:MAG: hypothetical protein ACPGSO_02870 [Vicingaceae bacterium]
MKGKCRIIDGQPYAEIEANVKPGDWIAKDGELMQVNQSTCIFFDAKIVSSLPFDYDYSEGDELDLFWDCRKEPCDYPFCGCSGDDRRIRDANKKRRS